VENYAQDILESAGDEPIEAIVLGDGGWGDYKMGQWGEYPKFRVLSWEEALPFLDREYFTGYGAPNCPAIYAWTPKRVIWVTQYDGSTSLSSAPRNPTECKPQMPGG
jgi:hypothetical protein